MSDRIFLRLNENFALGADELQWILYRRPPRKGLPDSWDGISFIRSTKAILLRCMREKGCFPDGTAATAVAALPQIPLTPGKGPIPRKAAHWSSPHERTDQARRRWQRVTQAG